MTWQNTKYCCINHCISQNSVRLEQGRDAECHMPIAKAITQVVTPSLSSEKLGAPLGALPLLSAQQKHQWILSRLGEVVKTCSKQSKAEYKIRVPKSTGFAVSGCPQGCSSCSASGQVCYSFGAGAKHSSFNTITNNLFARLFYFWIGGKSSKCGV